MESIDPQMAARVWQRVQGAADTGTDVQSLLDLVARERADAATYLHLSRRFRGRESMLLRNMAQQEQSHAACLSGIYSLMTGSRPELHTPPVPRESTQVLLRRCYGREMQSLSQYEERASDPQYGQVYARLAQQEREHCRLVLELLGQQGRKS